MHVLRSLTAAVFALILAATIARSQSVQTTTVTGTVYAAGGAPVSGSLQISWPAFTTAAGQAIAAGHVNVNIPATGQVSVPLAPNIGAAPAGLYYTAVYHLADGTTSTEYWVVPNSMQTTIGQIRAKVMPAAQAVQAVSKSYVDQSIQQAVSSQITPSGGTLTGPLYLAGDPTQPNQASNKHYVDTAVEGSLPLGGGTLSGPVTATRIGAVYQADQFPGSDFGAQLQACVNALDVKYGGTCDARNFQGQLSMASNLTVSTGNVTINLPCSTIATAASVVVPAGTRNVTLHGCASRGTSAASGAQGGTVFSYSGSTSLLAVGDPSFLADTKGFRLDNAALNTTAATSANAQAIAMYRTQEISLVSLYLLGNGNQTAVTLDGTGNYTGGTFEDLQITGYQTAVSGIGHTVSNPATTDWLNASTFVRLHIDCPTQSGNPVSGTIGINLNAGDGNTITGGDVESCSIALHLGPHAVNNTILGLRNENSTTQIQADPGSSYNNWITGGTMFTGKLVDQGTRNSFLDTFHRSFNALNGDWYGSQQDATVTNHFRLGTGSGIERGLLDRYQTDYGYRWTTGISDASAGIQYYQVLDELNSVYRLSIGQYNNGQGSTNNQTVVNAAGTGAVILNGSNNAGTGGVVFGSGGLVSSTVATIDKAGNAHFTGTLLTDQTTQSTGTITVRNNADAEVDYYLWPGATASQKGSFTYKDFNGASQWYMVKDQNNNWALNSAVGGLDSFKAYQSSNSGDTYINASNATGHIRLNYETGAGAETDIYSGSSSSLAAAFLNPTAIKLPGLAAGSGKNCLQIDSSGYLSNTTAPCSNGSGTVNTGTTGQIGWYAANGAAISGTATVPLAAGGTGAATAAAALANLGALPLAGGTLTGPVTASQFNGPVHGNVTGNVTGNVMGNLAGNVTFADNSVQTTSQQGALTGSANDATARTAAAASQTSANQAETDAQTGITNAAAAQVSANNALNGQANDSAARTAAAAAETDAQAGISNAAAAQSAANSALNGSANDSTGRTAATAAQTSASQAETDAQTGISNAAGAQASANSALNGQANDSTARTAAATAETDAQSGISAAATAQAAASAAQSAASQAEADAQAGISNAAAALSAASGVQDVAGSAQTTASAAQAAAVQAEADAQTALTAANDGQTTAASAQTAASAAVATANQAESDSQTALTAANSVQGIAAAAQAAAQAALNTTTAGSSGSGTANVVTFPGTVAANTVLAQVADGDGTTTGRVVACSFPGTTMGDKIQAANDYAMAHSFSVVDASCFASATGFQNPGFQSSGVLCADDGSHNCPLEIGKTASITLLLPANGEWSIAQNTASHSLPTPAAPSITIGSATSLGTVVSASGCTVTGPAGSTVTLQNFDHGHNGLVGAVATGTLASANTLVGAVWAVTTHSDGAASAPTIADCYSGSATTTGAATIVSTLADGTFTNGTYYAKINLRTAGGVSASSPEVPFTVTHGIFSVSTPPECSAPGTWARSWDLSLSTTSGTEMLQQSATCTQAMDFSTTITADGINALYSNMPLAPAAANGLPAVILHADTNSALVSQGRNGMGFRWDMGNGMYVSNVLGMTGKGSGGASLAGQYFHMNQSNGRVTEAVVFDGGSFTPSFRRDIAVMAAPGLPGNVVHAYEIAGTVNDVIYDNVMLNGVGQKDCDVLYIHWIPESLDGGDAAHTLLFNNLQLISPCSSSTQQLYAATIQGPTGYNRMLKTGHITFSSLSIENNRSTIAGSYLPMGMHIQNAANIHILSAQAVSGMTSFIPYTIDGISRPDGTPFVVDVEIASQRVQGINTVIANNINGDTIAPGSTTSAIPPYYYAGGLSPVAQPVSSWGPVSSSTNIFTVTQGATKLTRFSLPNQVQASKLTVRTSTISDGTNGTSFGIYTATGKLLAHTAAQAFPSASTNVAVSLVEGTVTLNPGMYLFGTASASSTQSFSGVQTLPTSLCGGSGTAPSGGDVPATTVVPANVATIVCNSNPGFLLSQ